MKQENFSDYNGLTIIMTKSVAEKAKAKIAAEASGEQIGLYTRWDNVNRAVGKFFRFGTVTMIGGMSGSGKSYLLNMLRNDFLSRKDVIFPYSDSFYLGERTMDLYYDEATDMYKPSSEYTGIKANLDSGLISTPTSIIRRGRNRFFKKKVILIHFGFEMRPEDELIRTAATYLGKSYGYLLSSEIEPETGKYINLSPEEINTVNSVIDCISDTYEYYVPFTGNVKQVQETIDYYADINAVGEDCKLIITIDHTLLLDKKNEVGDAELQQNIAKLAIHNKQKYDAMVILLNQLNQEIEQSERIEKPLLHFPKKKDLHQGASIWWACDIVAISHRPEILRIGQYGIDKLNTKNLIHFSFLKGRNSTIGEVYLKENFANGRILEAKSIDFKTSPVK